MQLCSVRIERPAPSVEQDCAEELFDNVSCYFPLAFTPPRDDPRGITRDSLSLGLEARQPSSDLALFCPLFQP